MYSCLFLCFMFKMFVLVVRVQCYVFLFVLCVSCFKCLFYCSSFALVLRVWILCFMFKMCCCIGRVLCSLFLFVLCVCVWNVCFIVRVFRYLFVFVFCDSCLNCFVVLVVSCVIYSCLSSVLHGLKVCFLVRVLRYLFVFSVLHVYNVLLYWLCSVFMYSCLFLCVSCFKCLFSCSSSAFFIRVCLCVLHV